MNAKGRLTYHPRMNFERGGQIAKLYPKYRRALSIHYNGAEWPMRSKHLARERRQEARGLFCDVSQSVSRLVRYIPKLNAREVTNHYRILTYNVAVGLFETQEYIHHLYLSGGRSLSSSAIHAESAHRVIINLSLPMSSLFNPSSGLLAGGRTVCSHNEDSCADGWVS